uniref:Uncharacterized protein n=1 Tax=Timema douglasi TaxID=61478 RepID=A0A7R8ZB15_TIMDO|nr:unnamed protein product [Timema douglasi]
MWVPEPPHRSTTPAVHTCSIFGIGGSTPLPLLASRLGPPGPMLPRLVIVSESKVLIVRTRSRGGRRGRSCERHETVVFITGVRTTLDITSACSRETLSSRSITGSSFVPLHGHKEYNVCLVVRVPGYRYRGLRFNPQIVLWDS